MSQSGPGQREVAYRLFAAEFDDSNFSYSESDEERAPNYVVTPTGARVNRLFAVGVLTEVEDVNPEMVRGRVVDPTGAFITYAGQYQPDALAFLERAEPPAFLAVSGKARTFEPEDGDQIYTSVRPESVSEVDADTRDRWIVTAAERTIERIEITASAIESGLSGDRLEAALSEAGIDDRLAEGIPLALDHYGTTPAYLEALRELAIDAVRVVAGERAEAGRLELAPDEGAGDASTLATVDLSESAEVSPTEAAVTTAGGADGETEPVAGDETEGIETATADHGEGSEDESVIEPVSTGGEEPTTEPAAESGDESAAGAGPIESEATADEIDAVEEELEDFDPGEFELDEEERREVEEEFGTEFSTAGEVESADEKVEEADESEAATAESEPEAEPETAEAESEPESKFEAESESETATSEPEPEAETAEPAAEPGDGGDIDLVDAVMEAMERLDDGDGADRDALVSTVTDEHGVTPEEVEDAIQDALMSGRCYEPTDGTLKSI